MAHFREDVLAAVRATFPKGSRTRAWEVLEEKLRQCVVVAKRDYRDALLLAECAEEAKLDTPEKKAKSARVVREAWA